VLRERVSVAVSECGRKRKSDEKGDGSVTCLSNCLPASDRV